MLVGNLILFEFDGLNGYVGLPYFSKSEKYFESKLCSNFSCIAIDSDPLRIALQ